MIIDNLKSTALLCKKSGLFDKKFDSRKKLDSKTPKNSIILACRQIDCQEKIMKDFTNYI